MPHAMLLCTDGTPIYGDQDLAKRHATLCPAHRSVYISGLPGTGKSHTVRAVLASIAEQNAASAPHTVFISCFSLKEPSEIYRALALGCEAQLVGKGEQQLAEPCVCVCVHLRLYT